MEKVGVEPQVKRIGKYKSAGDQLLLRDMSEPQREQLTALLEDIYEGFTTTVAHDRKKTVEEVRGRIEALELTAYHAVGYTANMTTCLCSYHNRVVLVSAG